MGIGRAIVEAFAARAATVVYADLTECLQQGVEPIAGKLNTETGLASGRMADDSNRITWVPCDVSDAAQVEAAVKHTMTTHGRIDVLVRKPTLVPAEKGAFCCSKNCSCQCCMHLYRVCLLRYALQVNNAGICPDDSCKPAHQLSVEMYDKVMAVNSRAQFLFAKHAIDLAFLPQVQRPHNWYFCVGWHN